MSRDRPCGHAHADRREDPRFPPSRALRLPRPSRSDGLRPSRCTSAPPSPCTKAIQSRFGSCDGRPAGSRTRGSRHRGSRSISIADSAGCGGHLGFAQAGRVDLCTVLVNEMARRNAAPRDGPHLDRPERVAGGARSFPRAPGPADLERVDGRLGVSRLRAGSRDHVVGPRATGSCRRRSPTTTRCGWTPRSSSSPGVRLLRNRRTSRRSGSGRAACPAASRGSRRPDTRTGRRSSGRSAATAGHRCAGSDRTRTCARSCGCARSAR